MHSETRVGYSGKHATILSGNFFVSEIRERTFSPLASLEGDTEGLAAQGSQKR